MGIQSDSFTNQLGTGPAPFPQGINLDPANMTDADATLLGLKVYTEADVTFSSTPAGWTNAKAEFIPFKTKEQVWFLKFIVTASVTSATSHQVTVDGITPAARTGGSDYAITVFGDTAGSRGRVFDTAGNILLEHSTAQTIFWCQGEIRLNAKPTWAS